MAVSQESGRRAHSRNRPAHQEMIHLSLLKRVVKNAACECGRQRDSSPSARKEANQSANPNTALSELGKGEWPLSADRAILRAHVHVEAKGQLDYAARRLCTRIHACANNDRLVTKNLVEHDHCMVERAMQV